MSNTLDKKYICTSCGGDAFISYAPKMIKRGKNKGQENHHEMD